MKRTLSWFATAFLLAQISIAQEADRSQLWKSTLETVWQKVNDRFYDPNFNGVDWNAVKVKYTEALLNVKKDQDLYQLLTQMLGELKASHFNIIPPAEYGPNVENGGGEYTTGMTIGIADGTPVVTFVESDYPAAKAGIKPGTVITSIGKTKLSDLWKRMKGYTSKPSYNLMYFSRISAQMASGSLGGKVDITLGNGKKITLPLQAPKGKPVQFGELPTMWSFVESKRLPGNVGYIRFNIFMMPLLKDIQSAITQLADTKGLIIDVRGNPGGMGAMAMPIASRFSTKQFSLGTMKMRQGENIFVVFPQQPTYKKKLAILTDCGSASTSEIFAGGLQEAKLAKVFGTSTAGAVLPSIIETLEIGARLQSAIADFRTPKGVLLEGRGVIPDVVVPLTIATLQKQGDPVLKSAAKWILEPATKTNRKNK